MPMRPKNPIDQVPTRNFTARELAYAQRLGVAEKDLQATHAQAVADGLGELPFIRVITCTRGGIHARG